MTSTLDRLRRLQHEAPSPAPTPAEKREDLRRRLAAVSPRTFPARPPLVSPEDRRLSLGSVVPGEEIHNACGAFYLAAEGYDEKTRHGAQTLEEVLASGLAPASFLAGDTAFHGYVWQDGLFLDTETTGLSGGTGTLPFLIGVGWFEDRRFVIRQMFLRDYDEEPAALAFLLDLAQTRRFLVSFNGKAFDLNLLASRCILHRMADPLSALPHVDLLHPARALLGNRTPDHRLATMEAEVLGFRRKDDIPGREIPQRYFDWIRRRDPRLLAGVFVHNRWDILSTVFLFRTLLQWLSPRPPGKDDVPADIPATASYLFGRGHIRECRELLESACQGRADLSPAGRRLLALLYKREHRWADAVAQWRRLLSEAPHDAVAVEEMAKFLEHRAHDPSGALALVEGLLSASPVLPPGQREALLHRKRRLALRLSRFLPPE